MKFRLLSCLLIAGTLSTSSSAQSNSQLSSGSISASTSTGPARSVQEIQDLRSEYHKAVISHDGPGLMKLVLPQASLWLTVLSEQPFQALKQIKPETKKVHASSFQQFASFLGSSKSQLDPRDSNVRIITDGTIATIYFDFKFMIDGALQNEGSETWQVVNTEDGWKIAAITYSSTPHHR